MFPAFLVEERKLWTMIVYDCSSNWKANKKKLQVLFFSPKHFVLQFTVLVAFILYGFCAFPKFFPEEQSLFQNCKQWEKNSMFSVGIVMNVAAGWI